MADALRRGLHHRRADRLRRALPGGWLLGAAGRLRGLRRRGPGIRHARVARRRRPGRPGAGGRRRRGRPARGERRATRRRRGVRRPPVHRAPAAQLRHPRGLPRAGARPWRWRLPGTTRRRGPGGTRHRGGALAVPRQRRDGGRPGHGQAVHRQRHGAVRGGPGGDGARGAAAARRHEPGAQLRRLHLRLRRHPPGDHHPTDRHRPGGGGDLRVPRQPAHHPGAGGDGAGDADRHLRRPGGHGLHHQPADAPGPGAGHRPGGGRRHRGAREHPPAHAPLRRVAAGGRLPRRPPAGLRRDRHQPGADRRVRAAELHPGRRGQAVHRVRPDPRLGGGHLDPAGAVADPDDGLQDPLAEPARGAPGALGRRRPALGAGPVSPLPGDGAPAALAGGGGLRRADRRHRLALPPAAVGVHPPRGPRHLLRADQRPARRHLLVHGRLHGRGGGPADAPARRRGGRPRADHRSPRPRQRRELQLRFRHRRPRRLGRARPGLADHGRRASGPGGAARHPRLPGDATGLRRRHRAGRAVRAGRRQLRAAGALARRPDGTHSPGQST